MVGLFENEVNELMRSVAGNSPKLTDIVKS